MLGSHLHSFLLSQLFGLYFVIISIVFLSRADYYKKLIAKVKAPDIAVMMHSALCLFLSIVLVVVHNIWVLQPRVLVTILCWLFLIRSVCWLVAPEFMLERIKKIWAGKTHYYLSVFFLFFGMYLMTRGFYIFMEKAGVTPTWMFMGVGS